MALQSGVERMSALIEQIMLLNRTNPAHFSAKLQKLDLAVLCRDVVAECFAIYRRSYWRSDAVVRLADRVARRPAREVAVLHCRADELPVAGWRNDIYVRERLTERFTLLHAPVSGAVQAIHLYRDERQGLFQPDEIDRLLGLAPLLRQAHQAALATQAFAQLCAAESGTVGTKAYTTPQGEQVSRPSCSTASGACHGRWIHASGRRASSGNQRRM